MTSDDADADDHGFRFAYEPGVIRFGRGATADLGTELAALECDRALVVTGRTVGTTPEVMDSVRGGLGRRLAEVFAETTPEKRLSTAIAAAQAFRETEADAFVGLGGGSSLDTATVASLIAASDRQPGELGAAFAETGTLPMPDGDLPPIVAVPTTLAGAELSQVAGITAGPESGFVDLPTSGGVSDPRLAPAAVVADPALFETTPLDVLAPSAMNGFDKGIETLYARNATPVTDATASAGLARLARWLPELHDHDANAAVMPRVVEGTLLCQYGVSRADATTLSLVHAFGHALRDHADMHQGRAHAIVVPHALELLFDRVDGRRAELARAFGVAVEGSASEDVAADVVDAVASVRDALDLPSRLRTVDGLSRGDFPAVAESVLADGMMANRPPGFDPDPADIEGVLGSAW